MSYVQLIHIFGNEPDKSVTIATHDLDHNNVGQQLSIDLNSLVESEEFRCGDSRLILDFKDVTMISSAALNVLIRLNRETRDRGIRLVLMDVHDGVREVFAVTRLERMFEFDSAATEAGAGSVS